MDRHVKMSEGGQGEIGPKPLGTGMQVRPGPSRVASDVDELLVLLLRPRVAAADALLGAQRPACHRCAALAIGQPSGIQTPSGTAILDQIPSRT